MSVKESTIPAFNPPGFPHQDDQFSTKQKQDWSETISAWMDQEISGTDLDVPCGDKPPYVFVARTPLTQFFNGTQTPFDTTQKPVLVSWTGFPKNVGLENPADEQRWKVADRDRYTQDEYCEWTVRKDQDKRIVSVTFTCEGPEYWKFLCENESDKMLALYKKNNPDFASQMKIEDFFTTDRRGNKVYQPYNKWNGVLSQNPGVDTKLTIVNPGCIMHLAQRNNSLSAEIDIAAQGTVIRKDKNGKVITDEVKLCNCSRYGNATRNSDPKIGIGINSLARSGKAVSIVDPVGIYFVEFASDSFQLDQDGTGNNLVPAPDGTFTWVRGDIDHNQGLRMHIQIPKGVTGTGDNDGRQLTVGDLVDTNNGQNVKFGAQFADYMKVGVSAVVKDAEKVAEPKGCPCEGVKPKPAADSSDRSMLFSTMATPDSTTQLMPLRTRRN
ncbi:hypothetical protein MN608_11881 [Microdochium nivale]|nr:hypothetical protein MN608_11881 [Microdochium nivale]